MAQSVNHFITDFFFLPRAGPHQKNLGGRRKAPLHVHLRSLQIGHCTSPTAISAPTVPCCSGSSKGAAAAGRVQRTGLIRRSCRRPLPLSKFLGSTTGFTSTTRELRDHRPTRLTLLQSSCGFLQPLLTLLTCHHYRSARRWALGQQLSTSVQPLEASPHLLASRKAAFPHSHRATSACPSLLNLKAPRTGSRG